MSSILRNKVNVIDIFEPIYGDILFRSIAFDEREGPAAMAALLEFQELPASIDKMLKLLADDRSDAKQVAAVAQLNPAVAAKILKVVNSSFTGLRSNVTSLRRALALLGYDNTRALIMGMGLFSASKAKLLPAELPLIELWKHSAAVSRIGNIIATKLGGIDGATLLSAGLLHDAGKLILAVAFRERYAKALLAVDERKGELFEIELRYFGLTHPILGAALCFMWNLPERLWGLIAAQEHPALAPDSRTAAALMLAEFFARSYNIGLDGQWPHGFVPEEVCWHLNINQSEAARIIERNDIKEVVRTVAVITEWE